MDDPIDAIKAAIEFHVVGLTTEMQRLRSAFHFATKEDLTKAKDEIMATIQEFATTVQQSFTRISTAVDGVVADVDALKAKIDELQNSPGQITPEDQALLDAIQNQAGAVADKLEALDAATETPPAPTPNA